jgi:hypothetical protein
LAADSAYGSAEMLAWLVHERGIEPHIPVFDNSQRQTGPLSGPTSPTITGPMPTSALPGRNSGNAKRPIGCHALSSMRTA